MNPHPEKNLPKVALALGGCSSARMNEGFTSIGIIGRVVGPADKCIATPSSLPFVHDGRLCTAKHLGPAGKCVIVTVGPNDAILGFSADTPADCRGIKPAG
jgi:hypothetical protein